MTAISIDTLCRSLNARRRELKMSFGVVAKRSGVSAPTVVRTLSGHNPNVSLENVAAIANALGMDVTLTERAPAIEIREQQACSKARRLSNIVQGTLGLESQAIDPSALDAIAKQTAHELLTGPARKLWSE